MTIELWKRLEEDKIMKMSLKIMMGLLFVTLLPIKAVAGDYYQQNQQNSQQGLYQQHRSSPSYNYRRHSYDNYQKSSQRYQSNPTSQNHQVMQQKQQIWQTRERQYKQNNWKWCNKLTTIPTQVALLYEQAYMPTTPKSTTINDQSWSCVFCNRFLIGCRT